MAHQESYRPASPEYGPDYQNVDQLSDSMRSMSVSSVRVPPGFGAAASDFQFIRHDPEAEPIEDEKKKKRNRRRNHKSELESSTGATEGEATPPQQATENKPTPPKREEGANPPKPVGFYERCLDFIGQPAYWTYACEHNDEGVWNCVSNSRAEERIFALDALPHCDCDPLTCTHMLESTVLLYGSVHLLTLEQLDSLLAIRKNMYVVAYRFGKDGEISGHFPDHIYHYLPEEIPRVRVQRKQSMMTHQADYYPHDWLYRGHVQHAGVALRSTLVMTDLEGNRALFKLTEDRNLTNSLSSAKLTWTSAVVSQGDSRDVVIPSGVDAYAGLVGFHGAPLARIHTFYGVLVAWNTEEEPILLSKAIISRVAQDLIGMERNHIAYKTAVVRVKRQYDKLFNLPEDMKAKAILVSTALALTQVLGLELKTNTRLVKDWDWMFKLHARSLDFTKVPYDLGRFLTGLSFLVTGTYVAYTTGLLNLAGPGELLGAKLSGLRDRFTYLSGDDLTPPDMRTRHWRNDIITTPMTSVNDLPIKTVAVCLHPRVPSGIVLATSPERESEHPLLMSKTFWLSTLTGIGGLATAGSNLLMSLWTSQTVIPQSTDIISVHKEACCPFTEEMAPLKYEYDPVANPIRKTRDEDVRFVAPSLRFCGIGFSQRIPYHFKTGSQLVERQMLEARCLLTQPELDEAAYAQANRRFYSKPLLRELLAKKVRVSHSAWIDHFPSAVKRRKMREALASLEIDPLTARDQIRSVFVKGEKSGYIEEEGIDLTHARHIVGGTDRYLATTGPSIWAIGNRLKEVFNSTAPIFYGSTTAEDCGLAMENQIEMLGGHQNVIFWEGDASRMDAHVHKKTLDTEYEVFSIMGATNECLKAIKSQSAKCFTVGGLAFILRAKRVTGDSRTSTGNTLEMAKVASQSAEMVNPDLELGEDYALSVNGDDLVGVARRDSFGPDAEKELTQAALRLGFRMKFAIRNYLEEVSFCSRLYWPTADGLVLGAKIGRWLFKAGYMFSTPQTMDDYRSQMIGHLQDNYFVPLVRQYCERVLTLIPSSNTRVVFDEYKIHTYARHLPTDDTLVFANLRYGLTCAQIREFEDVLSRISSLPVVVYLPWLDNLYEIDQ